MKIFLAVIVSLIAFALFLGMIVLIRRNKSKKWSAKYLWAVPVILVSIAVLWGFQGTLGTPSKSLQSPSLQMVWETTKNHWLWIFLTLVTLYILTLLIPEEKNGVATRSQWLLVSLGALLFVVFPVLSWVAGSSSSGCVAGHPCVLSSNDDGSSNVVEVKKGQVACFDPWMWPHLEELGLMISYRAAGIPERPFPCSVADVYKGTCSVTYDRFSFKPKHKIPLPNYWFVASGSKQC